MPAVTFERSSTSRPENTAPAGTSTAVALPPAQMLATLVGLVGVVVGALTSRYRTSPSIGATSPNVGPSVTLPLRLTLLVRSWRVGLAVVPAVPRSASPGGGCWLFPDDVHPASRPST